LVITKRGRNRIIFLKKKKNKKYIFATRGQELGLAQLAATLVKHLLSGTFGTGRLWFCTVANTPVLANEIQV
jgi:hypothetical protein